jgi:hypothetical protein
MKFKMTIPSAILGLVVFAVVALQGVGKYNSGKWSGTVGIVVALAGAATGLALAVTAPIGGNPPRAIASKPPRQFRNLMLLWFAVVVIALLMFRVLDASHINWRQYLN